MKTTLTLIGIGVGITLLSSLFQGESRVVVERRFDWKPGEKIEGIGTCSLQGRAFNCWDMDGRRDPQLTQAMQSGFQTFDDKDWEPIAGSKTRFLLLLTCINEISYSTSNQGGVALLSGNVLLKPHPLTWFRVDSHQDRSKAGLLVTLRDVPIAEPVNIPPKVGASARYRGVSIRIESIEELTDGPDTMPTAPSYDSTGQLVPLKRWRIAVRFGAETLRTEHFRLSAVDASGKPVRFADKEGHPVTTEDFIQELKESVNFADMASFQAEVSWRRGPSPQVHYVFTTIDPFRIGRLHLTPCTKKEILVNGFPLDPR